MLPMGEYTLSVEPTLIRLESSEGVLVELDKPLTPESFEQLADEMKDEINGTNDVFSYDIVNGIHLAYEDDSEFEADCLLWLKELASNACGFEATALMNDIDDRLEDMGRCKNCGCLLEKQIIRVPHTELDGNPYETVTELFCPECDYGGYNEQQ